MTPRRRLGARRELARPAADEAFRRHLTAVLARAAEAGELDLDAMGLSAAQLTASLMQLGHGASYGARDEAEQRENLEGLVKLVLETR